MGKDNRLDSSRAKVRKVKANKLDRVKDKDRAKVNSRDKVKANKLDKDRVKDKAKVNNRDKVKARGKVSRLRMVSRAVKADRALAAIVTAVASTTAATASTAHRNSPATVPAREAATSNVHFAKGSAISHSCGNQ